MELKYNPNNQESKHYCYSSEHFTIYDCLSIISACIDEQIHTVRRNGSVIGIQQLKIETNNINKNPFIIWIKKFKFGLKLILIF